VTRHFDSKARQPCKICSDINLRLGLRCAGKVPASWSKLSQLTEMSLSGNALTGTVPARLAGISRLDVSHNQFLCGSLPVAPNATLLSQRTSIGQDCRSLNKQAARISGMTGVILGEHQHAPGLVRRHQ
jgi:hypothetical protein